MILVWFVCVSSLRFDRDVRAFRAAFFAIQIVRCLHGCSSLRALPGLLYLVGALGARLGFVCGCNLLIGFVKFSYSTTSVF